MDIVIDNVIVHVMKTQNSILIMSVVQIVHKIIIQVLIQPIVVPQHMFVYIVKENLYNLIKSLIWMYVLVVNQDNLLK